MKALCMYGGGALGIFFILWLTLFLRIEHQKTEVAIPTETAIATSSLELTTEVIPVLPVHEHVVGRDTLGDFGHHINTASEVVTVPRDMWVTGMRYQVEGASVVALHHGTVFRLDKRDLECPEESPQPLLSVSQDHIHTPKMTFPDGYGLFLPKGTQLVLDSMFHNPAPPVGPGEIYTDVSLTVVFTLADQSTQELKPLTYHLLRLSETPCRETSHTFQVPPGGEYTFSGTDQSNDASRLMVEKPSRIVYWGGHLHGWEGGKTITVYKNKEVVTVFETDKSDVEPYGFDTPHNQTNIGLVPGDMISIEALYENNTGQPLRGVMGHVALYLAEE